jgi:hypothetical protein
VRKDVLHGTGARIAARRKRNEMARKNDNMPASVRNETAECRPEPTGVDTIRSRILTVRGVQVMLDRDLAELYGVPTKALNQAVKRNIERFPAEFMFALQVGEMSELVTNCDRFKRMKHSSVPIGEWQGLTPLVE